MLCYMVPNHRLSSDELRLETFKRKIVRRIYMTRTKTHTLENRETNIMKNLNIIIIKAIVEVIIGKNTRQTTYHVKGLCKVRYKISKPKN